MKLNLTLACNMYDRTLALHTGSVTPNGIALNYLIMNRVGEIFRRQARYAEFDVSEMSLCTYSTMLDRGDHRLIAIPVFPSRKFRHSDIFINTHAGISEPQDLIGKRMGCHEYLQTAGIWQRGHLQHDYGVSLDQMEWYFGPMVEPDSSYAERLPVQLPDSVRATFIGSDQWLDKMLDDGAIDAVMWANEPPSFVRGSPNVARLFPNFQEVEADYFRRTGIFPVMHTVVIKREIYDRSPWVAMSLYEAFVEAKAEAMERQQSMSALFSMLPWIKLHLQEQEALLGHDPFSYGLEANRHLLETFAQYMVEQGLTRHPLTPETLFAPETHDTTRD